MTWRPGAATATTLAGVLLFLLPVAVGLGQDRPPLEFTRWSGKLNVPDPVAISFDGAGRAYVTQTLRRKVQDLDIRAHREWIASDVGLESVAEKQEFLRAQLRVDQPRPEQSRWVEDLNGDGRHDYRDLRVLSERIHRLEDSDGDGVADRMGLFAEGFQTEVTGIAAGVLAHQGAVYATIAPDVWRLRDTDGDGRADSRQVIATGFGLHIAYAGHDMHGLTVGPDGKIYWSIGDKGISVTGPAGERFHYPNQGGVLRCNPDGSDFEVFAHGLRNVQELAFDRYGNLFGVDNDADQPNERERFVYLVPGMDAGWRCNYQYRGDQYNPWTDERLWVPHFPGQAAYLVPPISHSIDGPAGFTCNPGTALGPGYEDSFFLTGAPNGNQYAFRVLAEGDSFRMEDFHQIGKGIPLVGINFGPDGALYGVDWGGGYPLNQKGAVWRIDVPAGQRNPLRDEVAGLLAAGFAERNSGELVRLLSHADQRVRLGAQFALADRGAWQQLRAVAQGASERSGERSGQGATATGEAATLARLHAIWGLGQSVRRGGAAGARDALAALLSDPVLEIRVQAARTAADLDAFPAEPLLPMLKDPSPRMRMWAALALAAGKDGRALPAIVAMGQQVKPEETYLRHALALALAGCGSPEELERLADADRRVVQLAAAVALRRLRDARLATFLQADDELVVAEAARGIHDDFSIPEALPALAQLLPDSDWRSIPLVRRCLSAALRLGGSVHAERIARYAARDELPDSLQLAALETLRSWPAPPKLDPVTGRSREWGGRDASLPRESLRAILSPLLASDSGAVQTATMETLRNLQIKIEERWLANLVRSSQTPLALRREALRTLARQRARQLPAAIAAGLDSAEPELRMDSVELLAEQNPAQAVKQLRQRLADDKPLGREHQHGLALLARLADPLADALLAEQVKRRLGKAAHGFVQLELVEALERRSPENAELNQLWQSHRAKLGAADPRDSALAYQVCLQGGDAERGRALFHTDVTTQCVRCHRVGKQGSEIGPRLDRRDPKKNARYLLESLVAPSAQIDAKYRTQVVVLSSGKVVQGVPVKQTDRELTLADAAGKQHVISRDEIEQQKEQTTSIMPELAKSVTLRDIRDLIAYLQQVMAAP